MNDKQIKEMSKTYQALLNARGALTEAQNAINKAIEMFTQNETPQKPDFHDEIISEMMVNNTRVIIHDMKQSAPPEPEPQEELVITDEWKTVLSQLNDGHSNTFITGPAGSGKSTLLQHFTQNYNGVAAIVAPTGVAALRAGESTIHRFFGFGIGPMEDDDIRVLEDSRRAKYRALDKLIIDEISMVRADLMDGIDMFLRKNGRDKTRPFGGCNLVMIGDLFQLPPVSKDKDEKHWLTDKYGTDMPYFFHAKCWQDTPLSTVNLTTIFRQKDPAFTTALNEIRSGEMSRNTLNLINTRVDRDFRPPTDELWLTLTTTNAVADAANQKMLAAIGHPGKVFTAQIGGEFNLKDAPTDENLLLKPGAVVMFIKNSADHHWVNGTLGKVVSIDPLKVEIEGIKYEVGVEKWEQTTYEFNPKTKKLTKQVKGTFEQIPLKLAAAITIHKSQGLSLDHVIIDLSYGSFAAGQAYVGLSRCRTLEGMVLRRPLHEKDLITSTEVQRFLRGEPIARGGQLSLLEGTYE